MDDIDIILKYLKTQKNIKRWERRFLIDYGANLKIENAKELKINTTEIIQEDKKRQIIDSNIYKDDSKKIYLNLIIDIKNFIRLYRKKYADDLPLKIKNQIKVLTEILNILETNNVEKENLDFLSMIVDKIYLENGLGIRKESNCINILEKRSKRK